MLDRNKIYKVTCIQTLKTTMHRLEFIKGKTYNFYVEGLEFWTTEDTMWVFEDIKRKNFGYRFYSNSKYRLDSKYRLEEYFSLEKEIRKQKLKKLNNANILESKE